MHKRMVFLIALAMALSPVACRAADQCLDPVEVAAHLAATYGEKPVWMGIQPLEGGPVYLVIYGNPARNTWTAIAIASGCATVLSAGARWALAEAVPGQDG